MKRICALLAVGFVLTVPARAQFELTKPGDPSRPWKVSLSLQTSYDDNINTSTTGDRQEDFATVIQPSLQAALPLGRTFLGFRYLYSNWHYWERSEQDNESHSLDLSLTHTFNPRLVLSATEQFRYGLDPGLVNVIEGVPVTVQQRGDYLYNQFGGTVTYNLSRRWSTSVGGGWVHWMYAEPVYQFNDRDSYSASFSIQNQVTPRTGFGGNYQYSRQIYSLPGPNANRNSTIHTLFAGASHQMNPQLSLQLAGGYQLGELDDGTKNNAPYGQGSLSYSYARESALTAGFSLFLSSSEASSYRSTESTVGFAQVNHRLTTKLRANGRASYTLTTYKNPNPLVASLIAPEAEENSLDFGVGLDYSFTPWLSGNVRYSHQQVQSQVQSAGGERSYDRNIVYVGLTLNY